MPINRRSRRLFLTVLWGLSGVLLGTMADPGRAEDPLDTLTFRPGPDIERGLSVEPFAMQGYQGGG